MSLSNSLENMVLNHIFRRQLLSLPSTGPLVCLSRVDPGEYGQYLDEPSGSRAYQRLSTQPSDWDIVSEEFTNIVELAWPQATGDWNAITHVALLHSDENMLMYGELEQPVNAATGSLLKFKIERLSITEGRKFSYYLQDRILKHLFGKTSFTPPLAVGVGLSRINPGKDGSGLDEPSSAAGYSRVLIWPAHWNNASFGAICSNVTITFPEATGDWGTITYFALFDQLNGAMLVYGRLSISAHVRVGVKPVFLATDLCVTLD